VPACRSFGRGRKPKGIAVKMRWQETFQQNRGKSRKGIYVSVQMTPRAKIDQGTRKRKKSE